MIVIEPYKFHPFWKQEIKEHLKQIEKYLEPDDPDLNELVELLESAVANCDLITQLRTPSTSKQILATDKLLKNAKKLSQTIDGPHHLIARFEAEERSVREKLRTLKHALDELLDILDSPFVPPPLERDRDPIERDRKPHLRQLALIVVDWIQSLDREIPLGYKYDVITEDPWDGGKLSFASRLVELCIWDYETNKKPDNERSRFISTIKKTGRPRSNLKAIMQIAVQTIESNPINE